jgi:hypothetical protein
MATAAEIIQQKAKPVAPAPTVPSSANPKVNAILQKASVTPAAAPTLPRPRMTQTLTDPLKSTALGVAGGIKEAAIRRNENVKGARERQAAGLQTHAEGVVQTVGQAIGLAGDVAFEVAKPLVPREVKDKIKGGLGWVMEREPVKKAVAKYGEFKEENPRAAANIEAAANIGSVVPISKGAQLTQKVGGKVARATASVADDALGAVVDATKATVKAPITATRAAATRRIVTQRRDAIKEFLNQSPVTKKLYTRTQKKGTDVPDIISQNDHYVPKVEDGKVLADEALDAVQADISPMNDIIHEVIVAERKGTSLQAFKQAAIRNIEDLKLRGDEYNRALANISRDFAVYEKQYGSKGTIPLQVVDEIKNAKYGQINWNNVDQLSADRAISRAAKETVENNITDADIRALNKEVGKLRDVQETLEKMQGRAVKGGRLGGGMARIVGAVAGASGGPISSIIGSMTAGQLAKILQSARFNNPIVQGFAKQLQQARPGLFEAAEKLLKEKKIIRGLPPGRPAPTIFMNQSGKGSTILPEAAEDAARAQGVIKTPTGKPPKADPFNEMFYDAEGTIPMGPKPPKKAASATPTIPMGTPIAKPDIAPKKAVLAKKGGMGNMGGMQELKSLAEKAGSSDDFLKSLGSKYYLHGSPTKFDVFDKAKFGDNEGMAAYGKGMYVATDFSMAKKYAAGMNGQKVEQPYVYIIPKKGLNIITPEEAWSPEIMKKMALEIKKNPKFKDNKGAQRVAENILRDIKEKKFVDDKYWNEGHVVDLNWDQLDIYDEVMKAMGVDGVGNDLTKKDMSPIHEGLDVNQNTGVVLFEPEKLKVQRFTPAELEKLYEKTTKGTGWQAMGQAGKPILTERETKQKKILGAGAGSLGAASASGDSPQEDEATSRTDAKIDRMAAILAKGKKKGQQLAGEAGDYATRIAKAIAKHESGGRQVKGGSGEFGIFQFLPATWKAISKQIMGKVLPQTAENETKVAMLKIKQLYERFKKEGADDRTAARNVALVWNTSLAGAEKPFVRKGTNKHGVKYDSGAYANAVLRNLDA